MAPCGNEEGQAVINYFVALAIVTAVGVLIGALMIRSERRHMERVYFAAREEMERLATQGRSTTSAATQEAVTPLTIEERKIELRAKIDILQEELNELNHAPAPALRSADSAHT